MGEWARELGVLLVPECGEHKRQALQSQTLLLDVAHGEEPLSREGKTRSPHVGAHPRQEPTRAPDIKGSIAVLGCRPVVLGEGQCWGWGGEAMG